MNRRHFALPEADEEFLDSLGLPWEALIESGVRWVLIYNFPVPSGYNYATVTVAIRIQPGYPDAQLDMAYFFPALARADSKHIGALTPFTLDGKGFQQWSRHRTGANPWRPGVDDLSTHLMLVEHWLKREFAKV